MLGAARAIARVEIGDKRLTIEGMTPEEQKKLVDAWIKSVSGE